MYILKMSMFGIINQWNLHLGQPTLILLAGYLKKPSELDAKRGQELKMQGKYPSQTRCNQGKKFAKPEVNSCIEEFDEKLNNFDIERKEQELTAKNAQSHQEEVESFESITLTEKEKGGNQ